MDSQVTLINPAWNETTTDLMFDRDSVLNAIVYLRSRPILKISTIDRGVSHTEIKEAQSERLLAVIDRRTLTSDTITFTDRYGGKQLKISDWMKREKLEDGRTVSLLDTPYGIYKWKSDPTQRLALYLEGDWDRPVAYWRSKTGNETGPFSLILESGTEGFREDIVASFVILETKFRAAESAWRTAEGKWRGGPIL